MIGSVVLNYRIVSLIGEGGMGKVYLGEHQSLGRYAAIKVLLPELAKNEHIRQRFINEARTLSKLNHQNIVTLYDFSDAGDDLLLIMEYVEGTPVEKIIESSANPIPELRCINIFKQVLEGFSYAHKRGVVHRDIKPANIVLQADDTPKILDFGIAKIVEGDVKLTKTGTRMGSVVYMSPEQVMGRDVDQRSDIYSLGVTLFEMLAGRLPYDTRTESEFDIQTKIVREPIPHIRAVNPSVSETVENAIIKATEKDVNYRFQSCEEFIIALTQNPAFNQHDKTVFQQPSLNKTVFQSGPVSNPENRSGRKNYLPLIGIGAAVVLAIVILFYIISNNNNPDVVKLPPEGQGPSNEEKLKSTIDLNGYYEGTIKDGTRWIVKIHNFDGRNFEGSNTIYWPSRGSGGLTTTFSGTYDKSTDEIIMNESSGTGSGSFTGRLSDNGKNMQGSWQRYSDGGTFDWNLTKGIAPRQSSTSGTYPQASERYLSESDLSGLSQFELRVMRNEIFARHGYIFKTDEMREHFESQSWYSARYSNVENMLSDIEKSNINLIKRYER
ncbi:MAG: protein kinase [Ignavibacteria bacterium]|nr:protein kinase [Ignavibacteria bacterium]